MCKAVFKKGEARQCCANDKISGFSNLDCLICLYKQSLNELNYVIHVFLWLLLFQCTKQMISERFGRGSRTVDLELEAQIEVLRDTKRKYENVLRLAKALTNHFYNMVQTQHALGDTFADLSQKSPELRVSPQKWTFYMLNCSWMS